MIKCVAIYPDHITEEYKEKVKTAVKRAKDHHFDEIFTSIHLPEYSLEEQLECFRLITEEAKSFGLEVTADIGGAYISDILKNPRLLAGVRELPPDFIRLDYGYEKDQVKALYEQLPLRGFVINASIYSEKEVDENMAFFHSLGNEIEIRACHNFYIREESGIDGAYALQQDSYLKKYQIPIYYCVPSYSSPRGPLNLGLCTLEKHRNQRISHVLSDLYLNYHLTAFMMADEWLTEEEYREAEETLRLLTEPLENEIEIDVRFLENVSEEERKVVLGRHQFRNDSPDQFLRSKSSREMAEFGCLIDENHTEIREEGAITIDNKQNKRYSGELQVVTEKAERKDSVNVAAKLAYPEDLIKLMRFREGIVYHFREAEK